MTTYYVAFDESHKPRGKIESNYRNIQRHLEQEGFVCQPFAEFPITQKTLTPYDVLVVPCPDFSKFSEQEIADISRWVREEGGGLLMLSHAGGDKGRRSNLSELAEKFGMIFESDQVIDEKHNCGMGNIPNIKDFVMHPISAGITEICFRAGCSLTLVGNAIAVASSGEQAQPFSVPVIVAAQCDEGRVVGIGSYEMFRDRIAAGFGENQHSKLVSNIFNWLVSEKRYQMRAQNKIPIPNVAGAVFSQQEFTATTPPPENGGAPPVATLPAEPSASAAKYEVNTTVNINAKSDLGIELTNILLEFENLKGRLEAVIRAVMQSKDVTQVATGGKSMPTLPSYESQEERVEIPVSAPPPNFTTPTSAPPAPALPTLTPLPEAPHSGLTALPSRPGYVGVPSVAPVTPPPGPAEEVPPAEETPASKSKGGKTKHAEPVEKKEDLMTEMETTRSQIISIQDLKAFSEKKFKAGKIDEASYKKQEASLDSDLKKAQFRLSEIEGKLKHLK